MNLYVRLDRFREGKTPTNWGKRDSVELAVYSAGLVLHIFEEAFPDDKCMRKAIEAAQAWLDNSPARQESFWGATDALKESSGWVYPPHSSASAATNAVFAAYAASWEAKGGMFGGKITRCYMEGLSGSVADAVLDAIQADKTVEPKITAWIDKRVKERKNNE